MNLYQVFSIYTGGGGGGGGGQFFYIGLYRENVIIFLSETTGPRALIFGMYHHLVDLYQVCSNKAPGVKNGPAPGVTCFTKA